MLISEKYQVHLLVGVGLEQFQPLADLGSFWYSRLMMCVPAEHNGRIVCCLNLGS